MVYGTFTTDNMKETNMHSLFAPLMEGDRIALGRAITLIESTRSTDQSAAAVLLNACLPYSGKSFRIAISGAPGVGKSTFIEALGIQLTRSGHRVAVLAVDPSSDLSHGSILGDQARMNQLSRDPNAFIRPSPSGTTTGGVARRTREAVILCEAAGFDYILIETVGVGQREMSVRDMTDIFLLLLQPGAGDGLQGIKRGIMESADWLVVNKADGHLQPLAEQTRLQYAQAVHLFPEKASGLEVKTSLVSALNGMGIDAIVSGLKEWFAASKASGYFQANRKDQLRYWFRTSLMERLESWFFDRFSDDYLQWEQAVLNGETTPFQASDALAGRLNQE